MKCDTNTKSQITDRNNLLQLKKGKKLPEDRLANEDSTHTYILSHTCTYTHVQTHACIIHTRAYTHVQAHTCIHTDSHIQTHVSPQVYMSQPRNGA